MSDVPPLSALPEIGILRRTPKGFSPESQCSAVLLPESLRGAYPFGG
jgi:hypothetical protein